jgi:hypothetical protein
MKRIIISILLGLLMAGSAFAAAGTVTGSCNTYLNSETRTVTFTWSAATDSGTVPTKSTDAITCAQGGVTATAFVQGYFLCRVETSTTVAHRPQASYDIQLLDSLTFDKMGASLTNMDSNSTEERAPIVKYGTSSAAGCAYVTGPLTFSLTGNNVNAASGVTTLYFSKP